MSHVQRCAIFKSWSATSASSLFFARFSRSSVSGTVATRSNVLPSGENSNKRTPDLCLVTCQGSPPSTYMNHTCCFFSFSSPAFIRNPTLLPSGDPRISETLSSPRVYCRAALAGPDDGTTHSCVSDFHGLSFSILFSATRYATREPSGEIRGENTRATRNPSPAQTISFRFCYGALEQAHPAFPWFLDTAWSLPWPWSDSPLELLQNEWLISQCSSSGTSPKVELALSSTRREVYFHRDAVTIAAGWPRRQRTTPWKTSNIGDRREAKIPNSTEGLHDVFYRSCSSVARSQGWCSGVRQS